MLKSVVTKVRNPELETKIIRTVFKKIKELKKSVVRKKTHNSF